MNIVPGTVVKVLQGVPLDATHRNTKWFATRSDQLTYFTTLIKYTISDCYYIKEQRKLRLGIKADNLYDCNYIMYQNVGFGDKWFFAFITDIEFINDTTSYISFEIDEMQTWLLNIDYIIKPSFVEREHVSDDTIGSHILDEGFALNDYVTTAYNEHIFTDWWICVGSTVELKPADPMYQQAGGYVYGKIYSAINWYCFEVTTAVTLLQPIFSDLAANGKIDAIVSIFMLPKEVVETTQEDGGYLKANMRMPVGITVPNTKTLNGYTPRNNKLLTYPYRSLLLSNNEGNTSALRYEFFTDGNDYADVEFIGGIQPNSRIVLYPSSYKGVTINVQEGVTLGNFPQCAWLADVYANWLAGQQIRWGYGEQRMLRNYFANLLTGGVVGGAVGEASGGANVGINVAGGIAKAGVSGIMNQLDFYSKMAEEKEVHSLEPPACKGTIGNGYTNISIGKYGFMVEERTITSEVAKSIDGYFDMFGYKVNTVKTPDVTTRKYWNYVKTVGVTLSGNIPADSLVKLCDIYNKGVTFWKYGCNVGDYGLTNSIL